MSAVKRFVGAVAFYPVTVVGLTGAIFAALVATDQVFLVPGLIALAVVAIVVIQVSMYWEVRKVHVLVNSQHDALIARVNQLVSALETKGEDVPPNIHKAES